MTDMTVRSGTPSTSNTVAAVWRASWSLPSRTRRAGRAGATGKPRQLPSAHQDAARPAMAAAAPRWPVFSATTRSRTSRACRWVQSATGVSRSREFRLRLPHARCVRAEDVPPDPTLVGRRILVATLAAGFAGAGVGRPLPTVASAPFRKDDRSDRKVVETPKSQRPQPSRQRGPRSTCGREHAAF